MNELANKNLSRIVTENYQAARVFEKYGLDFCCKGKRPLQEACDEKGIATEQLLGELEAAIALPATGNDFNQMSLTELAEYIVRVHHSYVRLNMPQIISYVHRVATKHGDRYPYMIQVFNLFAELQDEMTHHMMKEEKVLFPRIKMLEIEEPQNGVDYLQAPIDMMEAEHDRAGTIMQQIRELTSDYAAPAGACTTFQLSLSSLRAFEEDLHQHVHLENNILFPKSIQKFEQVKTASVY
ncbi:MAG TPA: iron-sulfur cluster repair di-iron protein [Flavisolibacter sp.]